MHWNNDRSDDEEATMSLKNFIIGPPIAKGSSSIVHAVRTKTEEEIKNNNELVIDNTSSLSEFPLALKMMFNYDAESNATAILKSMYKETVPALKRYKNDELGYWEQKLFENNVSLPPHPNIVAMYSVFADRVPSLPYSLKWYPDALPPRLNPEGSGRNMSLFLLMKRYFLLFTLLVYKFYLNLF